MIIDEPWVQQVGGQATDFEIRARDLIATLCFGREGRRNHQEADRPFSRTSSAISIMTAQQALDCWIVDTIIKKYDRVVTPNSTRL
jgi:ATP-dependent protease ClpP protease subunit